MEKNTTIKVKKNTSEKIGLLKKKLGCTKSEIIEKMADFFLNNSEFLYFDSSLKYDVDFSKNLENNNSKIFAKMNESINRIIGFIIVQDELIKRLREDIFWKLDDGEYKDLWNPMFRDFELVLNIYLEELLNIYSTEKNLNKILKNKLNLKIFRLYEISRNNIMLKKDLYKKYVL